MTRGTAFVACLLGSALFVAPALAETDPSGFEGSMGRSDVRLTGIELGTGLASPKNASTALQLGGKVHLGMLRQPWLALDTGVTYWRANIERKDLGSEARGTISDLAFTTDARWHAVSFESVAPYFVTGLGLHRVGANVPDDESLEEALTGLNLGADIGFGVMSTKPGVGWKAEFRRRFVGNADSWALTAGATWRFGTPARLSPERGIQSPSRDPFRPADARVATQASLETQEPGDASAATRLLLEQNRTLRAELDAVRREMAARSAADAVSGMTIVPGSSDAGSEIVAVLPAPAAIEQRAAERRGTFPLALGERRLLEEIALGLDNPVVDPTTRATLDVWGALLAEHPAVVVRLLVHGGGIDPARALTETERQANVLRSYLAVAGAKAAQVIAIGLGRPVASPEGVDPITGFVEIERLR